jgi:hypothetical protein
MRLVAYQGYPNMSVKSNALDEVLSDYDKFLQNKDLARLLPIFLSQTA